MPGDQKPAKYSFGARLVVVFTRLGVKAASFVQKKKVKISILFHLRKTILEEIVFSAAARCFTHAPRLCDCAAFAVNELCMSAAACCHAAPCTMYCIYIHIRADLALVGMKRGRTSIGFRPQVPRPMRCSATNRGVALRALRGGTQVFPTPVRNKGSVGARSRPT